MNTMLTCGHVIINKHVLIFGDSLGIGLMGKFDHIW